MTPQDIYTLSMKQSGSSFNAGHAKLWKRIMELHGEVITELLNSLQQRVEPTPNQLEELLNATDLSLETASSILELQQDSETS
jgi:hypothetical protein